METWFQSEGFHHYLIIGTKEADIDSFAWRMLMHYEGNELLPFELSCQNGNASIRYEIRGFASLQEYFAGREMDARELRALFQAVWNCYEELEDHLLSMEGFLLKPEWVYYQPGSKQFHFCYCPGASVLFQEEFSSLVEFCLRCTRHQDSDGVQFIYGLYRLIQEGEIEGGTLQRYLAERSIRTTDTIIGETGIRETTEHEVELEIGKGEIINGTQTLPWKHQDIAFYIYAILSGSALCAVLIFGIRFLIFTHRETDLKISIILAVIMLFFLYSMLQSRQRPLLVDVDNREDDALSPVLVRTEVLQEDNDSDISEAGETAVLQLSSTGKNESIDEILWLLEDAGVDNRRIPLSYLPGVLGRDGSDVDYVVPDEGISRRHLMLFLSGEELYAEDLASTNGTYINGRRLKAGEPVQLCEGDCLFLGSSRYQVQKRKKQS